MREYYLLRSDIVFLNHGSFGACPRPVFEEYQRWQRELEYQPVDFIGRRLEGLLLKARQSLARYVGTQADQIVYVSNATTGLNIIARSLNLKPGDEVLATDHEYGALDLTWRYICQKRGAKYINQPVPLPVESVDQVVEAVWSGVTDRTRVLFLSHITSPTALKFPVAALVQRARDKGIMTVIDGAHAPGQISLNLDELGVDYYVGNLHKWLSGPKGSAFLYARKEMQRELEPLVVSWGWSDDESESNQGSRFVDIYQWQGTHDPAAFLSVPAAIEFQAAHNWQQVRQECHELLRDTRGRIAEMTGLEPICPDSSDWYVQMATCPLPPCDAEELQKLLWEDYRIEVPIIDWNGKQFVRITVQAYNNKSDLDALIEALKEILPLKQ